MKKSPRNPISKEDREVFWQEVMWWQKELGLGDWRLGFDKRPSRYMAEVSKFDLAARVAVIKLGTDFYPEEVTPESLSKTALHEMLHLLNYEMLAFAENDGDEADIVSAEHRQINILEKKLAPLRWESK